MPDSTDIDVALVAKLAGDSALRALMTDGVYLDEASAGKTRFVIVSLQHSADEYTMGESAFEEATYLVKAVARDTSNVAIDAAAKRIHELLQDATLTILGYATMVVHRLERIRYVEPDENTEFRWQHRGGLYQVMVSPT